MSKALRDELSKDVEIYVKNIFLSYARQLDDEFVGDIVKEVVETSGFYEGHYNDCDISLAFQRVTLGRMGCAEWEIYSNKQRKKEMKAHECKCQR